MIDAVCEPQRLDPYGRRLAVPFPLMLFHLRFPGQWRTHNVTFVSSSEPAELWTRGLVNPRTSGSFPNNTIE